MNKILFFILMLFAVPSTTFAFSDITGHLFESDILELKESRIINGFEDGTFRPDDYVTREQAVIMLHRASERYE